MSPNTYRLFPACKAPSCLETSLTLTTTLQGKAHNTCRTREETEAQRGEAAPSAMQEAAGTDDFGGPALGHR